jgi:hypothetical protein
MEISNRKAADEQLLGDKIQDEEKETMLAATSMADSHKQLAKIEQSKLLFRKPKLVVRMCGYDTHGAKTKSMPGKGYTVESCSNYCN